jgi:hypothetical protein
MKILLNDILQLKNLDKVKLRFNLHFGNKKIPAIDYFVCGKIDEMLNGQYWNYSKKRNFKDGDVTLGFVPLPKRKDCWLLFHVGQVTKDLNIQNGVGYDYKYLNDYDKYLGRIIISFKNEVQNLIRKAETTIDECEIVEILPQPYSGEVFPGYDNVNVSWRMLEYLIKNLSWRTALANQKGVYLLRDLSNGKKYVGSAYGQDMLLSRWEQYIKTSHGGNVELKELVKKNPDYIKDNFYFSILETFNNNINDQDIIDRETYWKDVLMTRDNFGYNKN